MKQNRLLPLLTLVLIGIFTVSCEKKELEESGAASTSAASSARSANLFYEEDMESSSPFSTAYAIENCGTSWTLSYVSNPLYQGAKSARFEIRKDQPLVGSSKSIRSEVAIIKGSEFPNFSPDAWYSFAILFPTVGFEYDDTRDCINQWFEDGSDETTIRAQKDKAFLEVTPAIGSSTLMKYDLFGTSSTGGSVDGFNNIPKDTWHYFVFHFIHSKNSDGLIEVWRDGVKIHTINGRNIHLGLPKWKIGLYKSSFLDKSSSRYSRVVYFDDVRVGNSNATLAEMIGTTVVTPPPTGNPPPTLGPGVLSFTLINADTDKDIKTLTNGMIINRKSLKVSNFNIRANIASGSGPVVQFKLNGTPPTTTTDDIIPYALFGDTNGDYNPWSPQPGSYTLEAITYSKLSDIPGTPNGTPYKITFSVK